MSVIANPASSGGRGRRAARKLIATLNAASVPLDDVRFTEAPGHAVRLAAEAARRQSGRVLVVGGDGTVHEVAAGLLSSGCRPLPPIAVHPVGTGNDFFRMIGGGRKPKDALALLRRGTVEQFDVGRVRWEGGERFFVNLMGLGVDVEVLRRRPRYARLPGLLQYLASFLDAVTSFKTPDLHVFSPVARDLTGDPRLSGPTILLAITVGPSIGGGFRINPQAAAGDGRLDACRVQSLNWREVATLLPRVIRGTHGDSPRVTLTKIESLLVRSAAGDPLHFELDGELVPEPASELRVQVLPGALPVLVPARDDRARAS